MASHTIQSQLKADSFLAHWPKFFQIYILFTIKPSHGLRQILDRSFPCCCDTVKHELELRSSPSFANWTVVHSVRFAKTQPNWKTGPAAQHVLPGLYSIHPHSHSRPYCTPHGSWARLSSSQKWPPSNWKTRPTAQHVLPSLLHSKLLLSLSLPYSARLQALSHSSPIPIPTPP